MKTNRTLTILAAGTMAFAVARGALAFGGGMHGRGALLGGPRLLRALNLSADQKQQVKTIWQSHRATLAPLVANERGARQALADKLAAPGAVTVNDLGTLMQQEADARTALMRERLAAIVEVRNVLTPTQIEKAETIRAGMKQIHSQMRQLLGKQGAAD